MKEINERIAILRKTLDLSMEKFGNKIGITKSSISGFEKGTTNPSEQTLKLICNVFNVDYFWLTEGTGEMFNPTLPFIDQLVKEYYLSNTYKTIIQNLLTLSSREREVIEKLALNITNDIKKSET